MKNKTDLKKYLLVTTILIVILTIIYTLIYKYEQNSYRKVYNSKLSSIINLLYDEYPNLDKTDIINILNSEELTESDILTDYGIDINVENIIEINNKKEGLFTLINTIYILSSLIIILFTFIIYLTKKDKKIKEITHLIEEINKKNYLLTISNFTEDELSILKNELYKTTIFLKEQAENSLKDKKELKNSLEDISHQLKTPLTSIMLSLDNLLNTSNLDTSTEKKFLNTIKREITNINFLDYNILNLSKLDTNTIDFINKEHKVINIINKSIKNIEMLCDLKNIKVTVTGDKNIKIICDEKWQIEAITNILKNAVEHSEYWGEINVSFEENKLYTKIEIKNKGVIDEEDLPHIFKRFYKGKNSSSESVGIGLALSASIIKKNGGRITAQSNKDVGTIFRIKYFKN